MDITVRKITETDSPSARIDQLAGKPEAEIEQAMAHSGALREIMLSPVVYDLVAARAALDRAMETATRIGTKRVPRLIHARIVEVDDLLDQLRRVPEGVSR